MEKTNLSFADIPTRLIAKWQEIADLLATIIGVPAALVMKAENEYMEVFVASTSEGNPYHAGDREKWNGHYCETVIKTQNRLLIPNATKDEKWKDMPDSKLGMIAYLGYPINFPNKKPFGTLCILDNKENNFSLIHDKLLMQFRDVIELDLATIAYQTKQRKIDAQLEEKGAELEAALASMTDAVFISDTAGRFIKFNDAFVTFHRFKNKFETAKNLADYPAIIDVFMANGEPAPLDMWAVPRALRGEVMTNAEYSLRRKDTGEVWYASYSFGPIRNDHGDIIGSVVTGRDITQQKLAQVAMLESEARLNFVLNASHIGVWELDLVDHSAFRTLEHARIFGYPDLKQKWTFELFLDHVLPQHRPLVAQNIKQAMDTHTSWNIECPIKRVDGQIRWVWLAGRHQFDNLNNVRKAAGFVQDITERKLAEDTIASEKERLAVTLRCIGDGVITTDVQGNVVILNKAAEKLTGWKQEEAIGKPLSEVFVIINELTRQPCESPVEKVMKTGGIIELANHTILISKNGSELILADSGAPIRDKESNIIGVVLVFRDMTEKQKLLDTLQRTDKLDSLGVLAGGIAHDFNNLLSGFFGYIDMAKDASESNSEVSLHLDKAIKTLRRAQALTQQLLTFSKGGAPIRKTATLAPLLKESARFASSGSNAALTFSIADNLWLCDFDENQMGQVVDNLIINAIQAMPLGGKIIVSAENTIIKYGEVASLLPGNYVHVSVADSGIGIPPSILPRIFDPFFTTKQKGNGLGLATAYSIITKHDGMITVDSAPDNGTTFHIYLPVSNNNPAQVYDSKAHIHIGSGRILIMDDEESIRDSTGNMLIKMGYEVAYALTGETTLSLLNDAIATKKPFTALIMDLTIPGGMGGKETIARIRETDKDLIAFVSSGYSEDPVMAKPTAYGFTDSIIKPFRKAELAELLNKHLKKA